MLPVGQRPDSPARDADEQEEISDPSEDGGDHHGAETFYESVRVTSVTVTNLPNVTLDVTLSTPGRDPGRFSRRDTAYSQPVFV